METEPRSICLEDLSVGVPKRMQCSHVFHNNYFLEWFGRKITLERGRDHKNDEYEILVISNTKFIMSHYCIRSSKK